ncbi:ATP-binding domain-containing protein [Breznakia blatticola]|uniref:ATP-binding domain-containing protein n=1 Tax=Breznakia blatticola TaxID=1754012 RepID=UPI003C7E791B
MEQNGSESDNVFVRLEFYQYKVTKEYRRKLFVAFSRAKNNLYISYKDKKIYNSTIHELLLYNLTLLNNNVD